jgi:nucleoside-diphosphate-sugar epimerase
MSEQINSDLNYIYGRTSHLVGEFNGKTILVTGGTGFIGKCILEYFLYLNAYRDIHFKVVVLSRNPEYFLKNFPQFKIGIFQLVKGDIIEFDFATLPQCNIIIHAATDADAKLNHENPLKVIETIISGTRNVFNYGAKVKVKRVLYLSSGAVYGIQPADMVGFQEDYCGGPDILKPSSAYSEAKRLAELLCVCYQKQYNLNISIARCFAFVGPYLPLDKHFAIGNFISNGLKGEDIIIKGTGLPLRSYMYSADLVIWLLYILFKGESGQAYNVGSEAKVTIKELAYAVAKYFPDLSVQVLNNVSDTDRNQNYIPNVTKIKSELFVPDILDLKESIQRTIQFHLEND